MAPFPYDLSCWWDVQHKHKIKDPEVASSIPARSHAFMEIENEIISTAILLPSARGRSGSVVECLTRDREAAGWSFTRSLRCGP